jgi:hypothetical protein
MGRWEREENKKRRGKKRKNKKKVEAGLPSSLFYLKNTNKFFTNYTQTQLIIRLTVFVCIKYKDGATLIRRL